MEEYTIFGARIIEKSSTDSIFEKISEYAQDKNDLVQIFDPEMIVGEDHLIWATEKAQKRFEEGNNSADSLEIEILLCSSGERQIKNAIEKMGLKDMSEKAAVVTDCDVDELIDHMGWERDDTILEDSITKLKNFGVSDIEIDSTDKPMDLVFEIMATSEI